MDVGTPVWVKDEEEEWKEGFLQQSGDGESLTLELSDHSKKEVNSGDLAELTRPRNTDWDPCNTGDLIRLPHLHEPAILHALSARYGKDHIYTQIGDILLAVNPFKQLSVYSDEVMKSYASGRTSEDPHVFQIARTAYENLKAKGENHSILVSGESGAGKTETTKYVMKYLATVALRHRRNSKPAFDNLGSDSDTVSIEQKVLQSNPILEAFGNSRTLRNDNSSRFGKYLEICFNEKALLVGASVKTYLLEKVRLVTQNVGERNFHVFYQICKGATDAERERWSLGAPTEYEYLRAGNCFQRSDGVSDIEEYQNTKNAMRDMKISEEEQQNVFDTCAALLHLGNIQFSRDSESSVKEEEQAHVAESSQKSVELVARLLCVNQDALNSTLLSRQIDAGNEKVTISLNVAQAKDARDALAKVVYAKMFDWIVKTINQAFSSRAETDCKTIGLLDIFGFEVFQKNSFEQLCINYANESLQKHFNEHVFKLEQALYEAEGISWSFVDFPDNQGILTMLEGKPCGLFSLLDQEVIVPKGSDQNFISQVYRYFEDKNKKSEFDRAAASSFSGTPLMLKKGQFTVHHFAGDVCYSVDGFLEKNRDTVLKETVNLLSSSKSDFIRGLYCEPKRLSKKAKRRSNRLSTIGCASVASQFRNQLAELLGKIRSTTPHYIRCIKPNDKNVADSLQRKRVIEQLRTGGVLEAVRVARAGYPVRFSHEEFIAKYQCVSGILHAGAVDGKDVQVRAESLLTALLDKYDQLKRDVEAGEVQRTEMNGAELGKTKVFFRKKAYEAIEAWIEEQRLHSAICMQRYARGLFARRNYTRALAAIKMLQRCCRGYLGRARARALRRNKASILIQRYTRAFACRRKFMTWKLTAVKIQARYRGNRDRALADGLRKDRSALIIQKHWRRSVAQKSFVKMRFASISIQCAFRVFKAKKLLLQRRQEANDVQKLKNEKDQLQQEVLMLRSALKRNSQAALDPALDPPVDNQTEHDKDLSSVGSKLTGVPKDVESATEIINRLHKQLMEQERENQTLRQSVYFHEEMRHSVVLSPEALEPSENNKDDIDYDLQNSASSADLRSMRLTTSMRPKSIYSKQPSMPRNLRKVAMQDGSMRDSYGSAFRDSIYGGSDATSTGRYSGQMNTYLCRFSKADKCKHCECKFGFFVRRHHCRQCGESFCDEHSMRRLALPHQGYNEPVRVCDYCFEEIAFRRPE